MFFTIATKLFAIEPNRLHALLIMTNVLALLWLLMVQVFRRSRLMNSLEVDALHQSQNERLARLQSAAAVAEFTTNAGIVTDIHGRVMWVNAGYSRMSGYSIEEVLGENYFEMVQRAIAPEKLAGLHAAITVQTGYQGEVLNLSKSGQYYWIELDLQPTFDERRIHTGFIAVETEITIRKEAAAALHDVEQFLKSAFDALSSKVVVVDGQGAIVHFNENWRNFTHEIYPHDNRLGIRSNYVSNFRLLSGNDAETSDEIEQGIRKVFAGQLPNFAIEFPLRNVTPLRWIELTVTPFTGTGQLLVLLAHNEITVRKQAELMVSSNEEKLRCIYDASSDAILLLNEAGVVSECNARALQLVGTNSIDEVVGCELWQLSPPTQQDGEGSKSKFNEQLRLALATGENRFEWHFSSRNGYEFPTEVLLTAFSYQGKRVLQCTVRDTSQRKEAEIWLQALNEQLQNDLELRTKAERTLRETTNYLDVYRKIVDHHAIVAETDTAGTIVSANDAFCKISGYSREELIGQNHRLLNSGVHSREMWGEMYKSVANGGCWHGEICNRAKNGQLYWVVTTISPLYSDGGKIRGYFAIRSDITSLKTAQAQAEAASLTKSEFLANMSHEIRTPMTAILGYADLLAEYLEAEQAAKHTRDYIETIKRNGDHLLTVINDILDISKIEADKMTIENIAVSPATVVREVLELMRVKTQAKNLRMEAFGKSALPEMIQTDPTRLRQILVNLVGNAIKFTDTGSIVVTVYMHATLPNKMCFAIRDTGIGMNKLQITKLFQAFEQADMSTTRRFGGTGLGLMICKQLANMLGGDIEVTSESGSGSQFAFSINCGAIDGGKTLDADEFSSLVTIGQPSVDTRQSTLNVDLPQLSGVRILLAEDGPDNQRLLMFLLKKAGADVRLVETGKQAVEFLTTNGETTGVLLDPLPVDLILMDMQMPVMDGYEATRMLKSKGCRIPILALTAHAMASDNDKCLEAGCNMKLTKPIDRQQLIEACEMWGRRRERTSTPPCLTLLNSISNQPLASSR